MTRIGLLSDTHGYLYDKLFDFFKDCDEIWHAGDIGNMAIADRLSAFKPFRAVYGNIDGQDVRLVYPKQLSFFCEKTDVFIIHIGGYPGNYVKEAHTAILGYHPKLFISGHSHILKVMPDRKLNLLHINPGAAGKSGLHKISTAVRFEIDGTEIKNLEVIELEERG